MVLFIFTSVLLLLGVVIIVAATIEAAAIRQSEHQPNELSTPMGMAPNDIEQCAVFEIRMMQQKMVDAGIIEADEMSVCENDSCLNCYPKPKAPAKVPVGRRVRIVRGETVTVPDGVPEAAYTQIKPYDDNFFYVYWSWINSTTGEEMSMRSMHPRQDAFKAEFKEQVDAYYAGHKSLTAPASMYSEWDKLHTDFQKLGRSTLDIIDGGGNVISLEKTWK